MYTLKKRGLVVPLFPCPSDMPPILHKLLAARGIQSAEEAWAFLHPLEGTLHDPFLFPGIPEAVSHCREAVQSGRHICVYGDYDVDGVCASFLLSDALETLGAHVTTYIPNREEGYGLHEDAIRKIAADGAKLLITVDCGISAPECVTLAQELGLTVIITDHHRADMQNLPGCNIVCAQMGTYPSPHLCGAGVAYKLACALNGHFVEKYIDIAAIATVADIVPLLGENRTIVAKGLQKLNTAPRPFVSALMAAAHLTGRTIDEGTIGFQIGPRINAAGRLADPNLALQLLRSKLLPDAIPLANDLNELNQQRKELGDQIAAETAEMLTAYDFTSHRAIILRGRWNPGIIGISASHLKERYHYPVILLAEDNGMLHGSCRSIDGIDIYQALHACSSCLTTYGGHAAAAGLSLKAEDYDTFCQQIDTYLSRNIPPETYIPEYSYDEELPIEQADEELCTAITQLAPFGKDNPSPLFLVRFIAQNTRAVGNGSHLKLTMADEEGSTLDAIFFRGGSYADTLARSANATAIGELSLNTFMNTTKSQISVAAILPQNAQTTLEEAASGFLPQSFLTDILYTTENTLAEAIRIEDAASLLCENLQGVTVAFADSTAAESFYSALAAAHIPHMPDVVYGRWTSDERSFSTIAVCPVGSAPAGIHTVIAGDIDATFFAKNCPGKRLCQLIGIEMQTHWLATLPDIADLRTVYCAARSIFSRPAVFGSQAAIQQAVAVEADLPEHAVQAALLALADMGLIIPTDNPVGLTIPRGAKADPMQNTVFQNITWLRERGRQV